MRLETPSFTIRPVGQDDLGSLLEVYRQCEDFLALGPVAEASVAMVLDDILHSREEGGCYCGIFVAGAMAGVLDVVPDGFEGRADCAFLSLLMIAGEHRGHGLGTAVVQAAEAELRRNRGLRTIEAGVQVNNGPAIRFWAKMGYAAIAGPTPMPDGTTVYRLRKEIRA